MAKQALKKAVYRNAEGRQDVQLFVGEQYEEPIEPDNPDSKTETLFDLVDKNGVLKIGKCRIGPKPGDCYLLLDGAAPVESQPAQ